MKAIMLLLLCSLTVYAFPSVRTLSTSTDEGEFEINEFSSCSEIIETSPPLPEPPEVIWHYSDPSGPLQKTAYISFNYENVFAGGWYSQGTLYDGYDGSGSILWRADLPEDEPDEYCQWLRTGTAASETADILYQVQTWNVYNNNGTPDNYSDDYMVSEGNTSVKLFTSSSAAPVWTYEESGGAGAFIAAWVDSPGKIDCSADGSVLAVGGMIDGHLAILFFNSSGSTPYLIYENAERIHAPRQLRLTADGSKCIFRENGRLFRVDAATGTLEDTHILEASCDCFAVSPDGSVIAYGYLNARIATWNGSNYINVLNHSVPSHYGAAAAIASDNATVYFGFRRSSNLGNRILRFDVASSTPVWTYDYPIGSGSMQDGIEWMDCSDDGRWMVAGSWGCQSGGGDEVQVFDDDIPTSPIITVDTPGSMFHVDMSADGRYVTAIGKHVHANITGAGTDLYFIQAHSLMGIEESAGSSTLHVSSVMPNPVASRFSLRISLPESGAVSISLYDLTGRMVQELSQTYMTSGSQNLSFDTDLDTGVYLCRISVGRNTAVRRLVVAR